MRDVAKKNLKAFGFDKEIEKVEQGLCPFCGSDKTTEEDFNDPRSFREFKISGLCQACQDKMFGGEDEDDHDYHQDDYESDFEEPVD